MLNALVIHPSQTGETLSCSHNFIVKACCPLGSVDQGGAGISTTGTELHKVDSYKNMYVDVVSK